MADLLSRLAARATGTAAPGATPRLPSLFEGPASAAGDVVPEGTQVLTSGADVPAAATAPAPARPPAGEPAPAPVRPAAPAAADRAVPEAAEPAPVAPAAATPTASPPLAPPLAVPPEVVPRPVPPAVPAVPADARGLSQPRVEQRVPSVAVPRDPAGALDLPRAPAQPLPAAAAPLPVVGDRGEPPPTVVSISIGRLEVRALPAGADRPAAPRPAPREQPRLGLHDYLRGVREPR